MPVVRHFLSDDNFVLSRLSGPLDNKVLSDYVASWERDAAQYGAMDHISDAQQLRADEVKGLTGSGAHAIANTEQGRSYAEGGRMAIVVSNQTLFGLARAFLTAAGTIRRGVTVTYSMDEALDWFAFDAKKRQRIAHFIEETS